MRVLGKKRWWKRFGEMIFLIGLRDLIFDVSFLESLIGECKRMLLFGLCIIVICVSICIFGLGEMVFLVF